MNSDAAIVIDAGQVLRPISGNLLGFNHRYEENAITAFDPETRQVHSQLAAGVRDAGVSQLRFPGGTNANTFRWKDAIGPVAGRRPQLNAQGWKPASSDYGPDEHMRFVEDVGAAAIITVNFATGTPPEAADWVEYMNVPAGRGGAAWADRRAANGHPDPYGVQWWQIGSEVMGGQTWLGAIPIAQRAHAYAFGGSPSFTGYPLGSRCDQRPSAGFSSGKANQQFYVRYAPVVELTLRVDGVIWEPVDDLVTAGPRDHVYTLNAESGCVQFGDGQHGAIPGEQARVTADYTATRPGYVDFYRAMKAADPGITICTGTFDAEPQWYEYLVGYVDCVADHPYSFRRPRTDMDARQTHDWAMARADVIGERTLTRQRTLKQLIPDASIAVTEYGLFLERWDRGPTPGYLRSLDQGLYMATELTYWIEAGVPVANLHPLVNFDPDDPPFEAATTFPSQGQSPFGYYPDFLPQAAALVTNLFSHMLGTSQVRATLVGNPAVASGGYPALRTIASTDADGRLTVVVVNRDPKRDVVADILPTADTYRDTAEVWTITGDSMTAYNSAQNPDAVRLTKRMIERAQTGYAHTFPACSVTALRLTPDPQASSGISAFSTPTSLLARAGEPVGGAYRISNPGERQAAGTISFIGPAGWRADTLTDSYQLAPGEVLTLTAHITAPAGAQDGIYQLALVGRQSQRATAVAEMTVCLSNLHGEWRPVLTDTFDDQPVGVAPATFTGSVRSLTVQTSAEHGHVLVIDLGRDGGLPVAVERRFTAGEGRIRVSFQLRVADAAIVFDASLADAAGGTMLRVGTANGLFTYFDRSARISTGTACEPGEWYPVDVVLDMPNGTYDLYVCGIKAAEDARLLAPGPPGTIRLEVDSVDRLDSRVYLDEIAILVASLQPANGRGLA